MSYYYNSTTTIAPSAVLVEAATIAANITTTLTNASDTTATATQDGEITETENFDPTIMILVFGIVIGLWCFAVCLTTKGCTDCEYKVDGGDYDDENGVWGGMMSPQEQRDAILARRLQRQEDNDAVSDSNIISPQDLELARQEFEQKAILRSAYLETIIPLNPGGGSAKVAVEEIHHLPQPQPQQQSNITDNEVGEEEDEEREEEKDEYHEDPENNNNNKWRCTICLESSSKVTTVKSNNNATRGGNSVISIVQSTSKLCKHCFHRQCIASWLISNKDCPICRQCYLKEDYLADQQQQQQQQQQRNDEENKGGDDEQQQQQPPIGYVPPLAASASPLLNDNDNDNTMIENSILDMTPTTTTTAATAAANNNSDSWFHNSLRATIANFQFYRPPP